MSNLHRNKSGEFDPKTVDGLSAKEQVGLSNSLGNVDGLEYVPNDKGISVAQHSAANADANALYSDAGGGIHRDSEGNTDFSFFEVDLGKAEGSVSGPKASAGGIGVKGKASQSVGEGVTSDFAKTKVNGPSGSLGSISGKLQGAKLKGTVGEVDTEGGYYKADISVEALSLEGKASAGGSLNPIGEKVVAAKVGASISGKLVDVKLDMVGAAPPKMIYQDGKYVMAQEEMGGSISFGLGAKAAAGIDLQKLMSKDVTTNLLKELGEFKEKNGKLPNITEMKAILKKSGLPFDLDADVNVGWSGDIKYDQKKVNPDDFGFKKSELIAMQRKALEDAVKQAENSGGGAGKMTPSKQARINELKATLQAHKDKYPVYLSEAMKMLLGIKEKREPIRQSIESGQGKIR